MGEGRGEREGGDGKGEKREGGTKVVLHTPHTHLVTG